MCGVFVVHGCFSCLEHIPVSVARSSVTKVMNRVARSFARVQHVRSFCAAPAGAGPSTPTIPSPVVEVPEASKSKSNLLHSLSCHTDAEVAKMVRCARLSCQHTHASPVVLMHVCVCDAMMRSVLPATASCVCRAVMLACHDNPVYRKYSKYIDINPRAHRSATGQCHNTSWSAS